ncbi:MAG: GNAT family N-acetyltransferase [bacterium]|nr:GNAT family N-acetyltransferase [bacterium]
MKIVDLSAPYLERFLVCLEDWSAEAQEGLPRRREWFERIKDRGLCVKLALDETDRPVGMIQSLPIEETPIAQGSGLWMILCIWVHGYKQGVGNHQGKGMGRALLVSLEAEARQAGAMGLAAWGLGLPFWMKASWFKKQGFVLADKQGFLGPQLVWKPFSEAAQKPRWPRAQPQPAPQPGPVRVTSFCSGFCMAENLTCERARKAAEELGGAVEFNLVQDLAALKSQGISGGLYIDGKPVGNGPPPSADKIRRWISKAVKTKDRSS